MLDLSFYDFPVCQSPFFPPSFTVSFWTPLMVNVWLEWVTVILYECLTLCRIYLLFCSFPLCQALFLCFFLSFTVFYLFPVNSKGVAGTTFNLYVCWTWRTIFLFFFSLRQSLYFCFSFLSCFCSHLKAKVWLPWITFNLYVCWILRRFYTFLFCVSFYFFLLPILVAQW